MIKMREDKKDAVIDDQEIHPFWRELINYVKENGGHLKMNIRFKDGIPVEADDIKTKVRFDVNCQEAKDTRKVFV